MLLQRDLNQNKCQGNKAHGKFSIITHSLLLLYFDCSAHCSFPGQCKTLIKSEIVSQRKPLLRRFDAASPEIRRHSNAFQAFEEIWLRRLFKLNELQDSRTYFMNIVFEI